MPVMIQSPVQALRNWLRLHELQSLTARVCQQRSRDAKDRMRRGNLGDPMEVQSDRHEGFYKEYVIGDLCAGLAPAIDTSSK